jgi:hypothetical protein
MISKVLAANANQTALVKHQAVKKEGSQYQRGQLTIHKEIEEATEIQCYKKKYDNQSLVSLVHLLDY